MKKPMTAEHLAAEDQVDGVTRSGAVKPQRNGAKPVPQEKSRPDAPKPAAKKGVVPRRAPARGKYIDEYARPSI